MWIDLNSMCIVLRKEKKINIYTAVLIYLKCTKNNVNKPPKVIIKNNKLITPNTILAWNGKYEKKAIT